MGKVRLSLLYSFGERYASVAIGIILTAILSRLLTPHEIGIFFVGMSIIGLTHVMRDLGIANYIIQESAPTEERIRTAATILIMMSWSMALLLAGLGGSIAAFYGEPRLQEMMWIVTLNFIILPIGSIISAQLRRELKFAQIARANVVGSLANAVVAVGLALCQFGFLSLAWGAFAAVFASTASLIYERPDRRAFRPNLAEWRRVLSFGIFSTATALLNELYRYAPDMVLGRLLGFGAVGLYGRANGLISLFNRVVLDAVDPVILPALSARLRSGQDIKAAYLLALEHITVFFWPFLITLAVMAEPIIRVLLGSQWLEAAPITRIIALAALINFPSFLTYPFLVALGRIRDTFVMSIISVPLSLTATVLAAPYGLRAVALSAFVSLPLQQVVAQWFIRRRIGVRLGDIARAVRKSAVVTAFASAIPFFLLFFPASSFSSSLWILAIAALGSSASWGFGALVTKHPVLMEVRYLVERGARSFKDLVIGYQ